VGHVLINDKTVEVKFFPVLDFDLRSSVVVLRRLVLDKRIRKIFAFADNHYAGHAPATVKQFWELWNAK